MSATLRGRTVGYDNISVGSATGTERTIKGSAPPAELTGEWIDNLAVGSAPPTANTADDYVVGTATLANENVAVGG